MRRVFHKAGKPCGKTICEWRKSVVLWRSLAAVGKYISRKNRLRRLRKIGRSLYIDTRK